MYYLTSGVDIVVGEGGRSLLPILFIFYYIIPKEIRDRISLLPVNSIWVRDLTQMQAYLFNVKIKIIKLDLKGSNKKQNTNIHSGIIKSETIIWKCPLK